MSEDTKKVEEIEKDAKASEFAQASELSEESLVDVAGGTTYSTSKGNIKKPPSLIEV